MKHLYKILTLLLLLAVVGRQFSYAQSDTIIARNVTVTTVCESYEWYGIEYTVLGDYGTRVDSVGDTIYVDSLHLTINHATTGIDEQVACDSFTWIDGVIYTESNDTATYTLTNAAGCDSVVTLHLTVNHPAHSSTTIDTCESYTWTDGNGQTYTTSGDYTYSHEDANGCTQVDTLHLIINQPTYGDTTAVACGSFRWHGYSNLTESGEYTDTLTNAVGCDSVVTLHLIILKPTHTSIKVTECDSFTWPANGETYIQSNDYTYIHTDSNGCTQVDTLHLTIYNPVHAAVTVEACESYTWTEGTGATYTTSGTYTYARQDTHGCWQVDTLHLTINHPVTVRFDTAICSSSLPLTWHDTTFEVGTVSGDYILHRKTVQNCDSIITLTLTVNPLPTVIISGESSFCQGDNVTLTAMGASSYDWNNGSQTATTTVSTGGIYTVTGTDTNGCRNTATQEVTETPTVISTITAIDCEEYTWNGTVYYTSGDYTQTLTAANGCDSVVTLHLTIHHGTHNVFAETACESYTWHGTTYTVSGIYTYLYTTADGCASADTLHLIINHPVHTATSITMCESYTWAEGTGQTYTTSGTYTYAHQDIHGCTQVDTLLLVIAPSPTPFIFGDSSICYGEVATLTAAGGETYYWSTEDVGNSIVVAMEGLYTVTATNIYGCSSTAEFTVNVAASPLVKKDIVGKSHDDGSYYMLIYPEAGLQYQWYKNSVTIVGATKQYYYPSDYTHEGSLDMDACYQVEVRSNNPDICGIMTDCWEKPESVAEKIRIIPNPNNGQFRLMIPEGVVSVQIINANGQIVMARKIEETELLDMNTGLNNGLYFVKIFMKDGSFNTEKLVINR